MLIEPEHDNSADYTCQRCGMQVLAYIPHECDPSICYTCSGHKTEFLGRDEETGVWLGWGECRACLGTGHTIWAD